MLKWALITFDDKHKAQIICILFSMGVSVLFLTIHGKWQLTTICWRRVWMPSKVISVKKAIPGDASCHSRLCKVSLCVCVQCDLSSKSNDGAERTPRIWWDTFSCPHIKKWQWTAYCLSDFLVCDPVSDLCSQLLRGKLDSSIMLQLFT